MENFITVFAIVLVLGLCYAIVRSAIQIIKEGKDGISSAAKNSINR